MASTPACPTKRTLSHPRRHLVERMQEINFGQIEMLRIRDGEPVLEPEPVIVREIVLGKANGPSPERTKADFWLRKEVCELFELFDREPNLLVRALWIQNGLPVRLTVTNERRVA
jgi:hypothetical protein